MWLAGVLGESGCTAKEGEGEGEGEGNRRESVAFRFLSCLECDVCC